jgi:hypothetical protein
LQEEDQIILIFNEFSTVEIVVKESHHLHVGFFRVSGVSEISRTAKIILRSNAAICDSDGFIHNRHVIYPVHIHHIEDDSILIDIKALIHKFFEIVDIFRQIHIDSMVVITLLWDDMIFIGVSHHEGGKREVFIFSFHHCLCFLLT